jgi:hypothetical protein
MTTQIRQELEGGEAVEFAAHHLRKVEVDAVNWQVIYEEPGTGEQWVMDYPHSEAQGGGSPRLRRRP